MEFFAVITGDLINSSKMNNEQRDRVLQVLKKEFERLKENNPLESKMFRGDSFQLYTQSAEEGLTVALVLKALLNKLEKEEGTTVNAKGSKPFFNARIAIGLGTASFLTGNPAESDGEAFRNSGLSLDEMKKKGQELIIKSSWDEINDEFETECKLLDAITEKWLTASAEVVYLLLLGHKEQEIADILNISQSAVNQRKKSANWDAVEAMINRYRRIILTHKKQ